jgi:hypothetical protein
MRGIAVVWAAVLLSLAWADGLREATLILRGEPLSLSPPPLWDGRELWLPVSHLERLGVPLEVGISNVRIPHIPADQPAAHVPIEPKRGAPCIPVRDLVRRLGGSPAGTRRAVRLACWRACNTRTLTPTRCASRRASPSRGAPSHWKTPADW